MLSANLTLTPFPLLSNSMMTPQTLGCALYQQVLEFTPLALEESGQDVTVGMNYVIDNLDPIFKGTTFGCSVDSLSNSDGSYPAYPYTNQLGSPTYPASITCSPPQSNVYNQGYFINTSK
jgi:hypothetical protein